VGERSVRSVEVEHPLKVAVIGAGWWGRTHVDALHGQSDKVQVMSVVDVEPHRAADFCAERGLPLGSSYDDALADPSIEAVVLATPHSLHTQQILAAIEAGVHVFTEKPFALSGADAERCVRAAAKAEIQLGLGHNQRFSLPRQEIRDLIAAGDLGTVMHLEGNSSHDTLAAVVGWRHDVKEAPAGGIYHMGSHLIDLFTHWVGPVEEVYAQMASRVMPVDTGSALLRFDCGATGYLANCTVTPTSRHLQAFGSKGWARLVSETELAVCLAGRTPEIRTFPSINIVRANVESFADAVAGRAPYPISHQEMVHDVAVLEAVVESLRSGRPAKVS
jgi:predicted dehydrogenase